MRVAYLDCLSGVSGDMMLGALIDAGVPLDAVRKAVGSLGLPSCSLQCDDVLKHGFRATKLSVVHEPEHAHRHLHHITEMIDGSDVLTAPQKDLAKRIFTKLGKSEAKVHGSTLEKVHFHEVGAVDSIADIVGAAVAWDLLGVDRIVCAPVPTGGGVITIAHGRVSVPAPATAELLTGIPLAESDIESELTTPTGAAIVATLVDDFGPLPAMKIESIGYGAGDRDLKQQANILRLLVGEMDDHLDSDQVWVLETNLDDVSGEVIGFCTERLLSHGALDVFTTSVQMKKNRPGVVLSVLCHRETVAKLERIIFRETGTLGVRRWAANRHKLPRREQTVHTAFGDIDGKVAKFGEEECFAPEYESCRKIANAQEKPLREIYEAARQAFEKGE